MRYDITFHGVVSETTAGQLASPPPDELEAFVDDVVDELEQLSAEDIDVSTNLGQALVRVSVSVESASIEQAQEEGNALVRSAFHAAGAQTPGWSVEWLRVSTAAQDLVDV